MDSTKPVFRHPDLYQVLPWREWIRENIPNGSSGYVAEDLDLIIRRYGKAADGNPDGRFMFIEIKYPGAVMGHAQRMTFGLIHRLLRKADPEHEWYVGFYLVHWNDGYVDVNGIQKTLEQFKDFLMGKSNILSLFDNDWKY